MRISQVKNIVIRNLLLDDLEAYKIWTHPSKAYHKFNGPYFKQATEEEHELLIKDLKSKFDVGQTDVIENKKVIVDGETGDLIGQVNWYWKSIETDWLEVGIVIFNENYWGMGIGYQALKLWINQIFRDHPNIVRVGLTTWSGNERMMSLAEKLGLEKEAVYRKARIVDGTYYDSISYGILKEDWA